MEAARALGSGSAGGPATVLAEAPRWKDRPAEDLAEVHVFGGIGSA